MTQISRYTLANGLRVVHLYEPRTAMAVVDVLYDVGARDESPELTGIAHLFEHLMFGGSANEPDYTGAIERAGGMDNAWTSADFTNFYEIMPAQNVETALRVESDRMLALSFNPQALEVQRSVVVEEFKETVLNRPYGRAMHDLREMLYAPAHPYSWPVIGKMPEHVLSVTDADVRRWFYAHYGPNNAVLAVVGGISPAELRPMVEKWFGDIPRRATAPRRIPAEVWSAAGETRRLVHDRVPSPLIILGFRMAAYGQPGYVEADLLTDILSAGRACRMRQRLMEQHPELLTDAEASITGSEHEGMLMLSCRVLRDAPEAIEEARTLLLAEARVLAEPGNITPHELERALNRYEARVAEEQMVPAAMARRLALAEMHGESPDTEIARRRAATLADLRRTAREIFIESEPATLVIAPEEN